MAYWPVGRLFCSEEAFFRAYWPLKRTQASALQIGQRRARVIVRSEPGDAELIGVCQNPLAAIGLTLSPRARGATCASPIELA